MKLPVSAVIFALATGLAAIAAGSARSIPIAQPVGPLNAPPQITIGPSSGRLGTALTVTLTGGSAPYRFGQTSTAKWVGHYQPMVGPPTANFTVNYNASQLRESSPTAAVLVVGDGQMVNAPNPEGLNGPGSLVGTFTFTFSANYKLTKPFTFGLETDAARWERVRYPDGPGGADPPFIAGEPASMQTCLLSQTPDPLNPAEEVLTHVEWAHYAAVVRVAENPTTIGNSPQTILVDAVSYNSNGVEIDRLQDITLTKKLNDGEPNNIVYHNDLSVPIVFVDVALNKANYPNVRILRVINGGSVVVVPAN